MVVLAMAPAASEHNTWRNTIWKSLEIKAPQCENFIIFLPFRFYVKSILEIPQVQNRFDIKSESQKYAEIYTLNNIFSWKVLMGQKNALGVSPKLQKVAFFNCLISRQKKLEISILYLNFKLSATQILREINFKESRRSKTHSVIKWKIYSHWKNISSNHLFSNFFSKTVAFMKFLPKMCESKVLKLPHCETANLAVLAILRVLNYVDLVYFSLQ